MAGVNPVGSPTSAYPVSNDPLMLAAWAHFALDQQIAGLLTALSDKVDGLRLKVVARNTLVDGFGKAVAQAPTASQVDFLQVGAAERDRLLADLTELGLSQKVAVVPVAGANGLYTFRVQEADFDSVGDTLSQGIKSLLTISQTQQLELQNQVARYSTLGETVASLQKSYVSLATTLSQSMGH